VPFASVYQLNRSIDSIPIPEAVNAWIASARASRSSRPSQLLTKAVHLTFNRSPLTQNVTQRELPIA
jgi:hypothetical protein